MKSPPVPFRGSTTDMTFQEARDAHLKALDAAYAALRDVVADPWWCNDLYKPFMKAAGDLAERCKRIRELNEAESSARASEKG